MIKSFKHKGLEKFFTTNSKKGIQPDHAKRLNLLLTTLNRAVRANNMDVSGWHFHPLTHWGTGYWAVKVNGNWRVTFRFSGADAFEVDYIDYHGE